MIASDLHGSCFYTERMLGRYVEGGKAPSLGDILYHGPRNDLPKGYDPKSVAKLLNSVKKAPLRTRKLVTPKLTK